MDSTAADYRSALRDLVWRLVRLAKSGNDLIALGEILEVLSGVETDPAACEVEVNVGVEVGFRAGDENFEEGLYYGFRVSDEGIEFDEMRTIYDKSVGSDHEGKKHGFLTWDESDSQGLPIGSTTLRTCCVAKSAE